MTRGRWSICIAAALCFGPSHEGRAETICGGLKMIFKSAPGKFETIRQPAAGGDYKGKVLLGPLTNCEVRVNRMGGTYQCMDHRIPADSAKKVMGEIVSEIETCFGKDVRREVNEPNQVFLDYLPNDDISIKIGTTERGGVVLTVDALAP